MLPRPAPRLLAIARFAFFLISPLTLRAASDITISTAATSGGDFSGTQPKTFTPTAATAFVQAAAIQTELNAGTGIVLDTASPAAGNGDVTLSVNLSKTAGAASPLEFKAARDIQINGSISATGGPLPLTLEAGRNVSQTQSITTNGGALILKPGAEFLCGNTISTGSGAISLDSGTLASTSSRTITTTAGMTVAAGASLRLQGTVAGPLTVAGYVSPAAAAGALQVNGPFALQAGATTSIELGGTSAGSNYDRITATGAVTVAGNLAVDLIGGFHDTIAGSSTFTIVQGASVTGNFNGYPNGSRYHLTNERGSFRVNYTATTVTLDDWQPVVTTLAWDPGTAEAGTAIATNTNTRGGRHFFKITTQSSDIGGWRTRLNVIGGDAALYMVKGPLAATSSTLRSTQIGSDGLVLREDQFVANEEWSVMVFADEGAQWSIVSGKPYVHDLGSLPFTDTNANGQYDIGEVVSPQSAPAAPMPPEGIRFYKSAIPVGTPAWSMWLGGSTREIAVRSNKLPFHSGSTHFTRKQAGQMLLVPPLLGAGASTWFASVVAPAGEVVGLDSRIQTVENLAYNGTVSNVAVNAAPYRVYRVQVPVDQIAWDINAVAVAGNPDICVRKGNVPAEFDNEAFSAAPGSATEGITLVPNYLTDGTWYITVHGTAPYTFTLKNGDPVITPIAFTDTKVNDQPARSGWRFYALTDVASQVGALGWELNLSNHVPGTQIALRRNKVPGRWQKRDGGSSSVTDTNSTYFDEASTTGFIQRVNHQADVWYIGIFLPQQSLGNFTLTAQPINPPALTFESNTPVTLEPLKWRYYRMDIPSGMAAWDLRLKDITGGNCGLVVRRDQLPHSVATIANSGSGWSPSGDSAWPSGNQWAGTTDWTGRNFDSPANPRRSQDDRLVMPANRPLVPGTYYVGIYNDGADPINGTSGQSTSLVLESRGIGSGLAIPITDLAQPAGNNAVISNLLPREAAYFKVNVPANVPSWQFELEAAAGEMLVLARQGFIPDFSTGTGGNVQTTAGAVKIQRTGGERYLILPENNQSSVVAGDYYIAVVGEGVNPPASNVIGTGVSSGTLANKGPLPVTDLGQADAAGITRQVALAGAETKAYQFSVPAGTASLEVRMDNRTGSPRMALISGTRIPFPGSTSNTYGSTGGQSSAPAGGMTRVTGTNLLNIANPVEGTYTITVRAEEVGSDFPAAGCDLVIVANAPMPLAFNATSTVSGQASTAWRYFQVTVPEGVMGWDIRLSNITAGNPQMVIRRDQLPSSTSTQSTGGTGWSPSVDTTWPTGNQWAGGVDWTARTWAATTNPRRGVGDRLVAAMGRPLVPGTYFVGVYNQGTDPITGVANTPAAYTVESRGIGAGQPLVVGEIPFSGGSEFTATALAAREAAYFKVTVPAGVPRWDFTLTPDSGEAMIAVRRGAVPDFNAATTGNIQEASGAAQMKMQRTGMERYSLFPLNNQDFLLPGDYYLAIVSEGANPPSSTVIGTGTSTATYQQLPPSGVQDLGILGTASIQQPVALAGAQVKAYRFTVPAGTASMEVRLDNKTGNPVMAFMSGNRVPQPDGTAYEYGTGGGQTSTLTGGLARQTGSGLINVVSTPPGEYTLTVRADELSSAWPDATADLVITASTPQDVPLGTGTLAVTGHAATAWKYFKVTVPAGIDGWDLRLKNITGGDPQMVVCRDRLPSGTGTQSATGSGWSPSHSTVWDPGDQWAGGTDWTGRTFDTTASKRRGVNDRIVAAMGRPLQPGTYYIGVYNGGTDPITDLTSQPSEYTIESRWIGAGEIIPVGALGYAVGSQAAISDLTPREAAYFKVTVPVAAPSWEFTLSPTAGEMMLAVRRGFIPDFNAASSGNPQDDSAREAKVQKAGGERFLLLPPNNESQLIPGDYHVAVISEGTNPPGSTVIGTGNVSGQLVSNGPLPVSQLGTAGLTPLSQPVALSGAQVKAYQFNVPEGVVSLEVQLNNRTGNPRMALMSGARLPFPDTSISDFAVSGGQSSTPLGGVARVLADSLITVANPPAGIYSLTVRADDLSSAYPDANADLVIVARPRGVLNFASTLNGNGFSHSDTRQLADGQKQFYEVAVPSLLSGQPPIGWLVKVNHAQGDTTLRIYKEWGNPAGGISITGNSALLVPPFLTLGETWYIEVTASGLTNYTITSQPVQLERSPWQMPAGHNFTFGDSGNDNSGNPLPGDRGVDIGQDDWHVYAMDVPAGNSGLLRTELKAISGNPNLYIREDGVPTTDHDSNGPANGGDSLVHRKLEDAGSEYGNWVPLDGRTEHQLRPGRWYLGIKASGGSNARYRLLASTGQVTDLDLTNASLNNQTLVGRDWRYYRFTVPANAPATWNLGFTQQVGDVVMWLRDAVPSGQNSGSGTSNIESWHSDNKNQGPYESAGHDAPGTYPLATPPLRPGHVYYAGFRANTDATFSVTSSTSGSAEVAAPLAFYNGTIDTMLPAGGSALYKIAVPAEATRLKWSATHGAGIQLRVEQGTLPGITGNQHYNGSGSNSVLNKALTTTDWPWQPARTYYLRIINTGASAAPVTVSVQGQNPATEDEDADGLLDAWEMTHFNSISKYNGGSDPDLDGVINSVEFTDQTDPDDINSAKYFLTVNSNFGSVGISPVLPKYDRGTPVTLTPVPNSGLIFTGWTGGASGTQDPLQFQILANLTINANFGTSLPVALDSNLAFVTGGDGIWTGQVVTTRDGADAAQSAPMGHSQETWMETKVRGAGTLSFWWKVSSASGDYLEFYINGLLQTGRIHGEVDWALKTYELPAGYHTLRWRYVKNSSGSENSDAGWIDQLTWSAAGGYNAWLASHFTPVEIADPAISGTTSDPDGDGATNLFEYAFGTDPDDASAGDSALGKLTAEKLDNRLQLRFSLPEILPLDIGYHLEVSGDLLGWTEIASETGNGWTGSAAVEIAPPAKGRREIIVTEPALTPASGKRMGRLNLTLR